jgi:ubiquinone/menaquinone biosynthesis C-methylase UbiE
MDNKKQKNVFLNIEGDKWFERNKKVLEQRDINEDYLLKQILEFVPNLNNSNSLLEIGCGDGSRLSALKKNKYTVYGIDPSKSAIKDAVSNGVNAFVGTADKLPFEDNKFEIVTFGFCLYLCDREDLFKIAAEADRVLKKGGYLFILDFYSKNPISNDYHHREGLKSYKMDYSKLFEWHPDYVLVKKIIGSHDNIQKQTDNLNDWISISILRKL